MDRIKTFDPDTSEIDQPPENASYQYWDRIDNTIFHQLEKPLDLNRVIRATGQAIGAADAKQADNINHLDEPPESSWYNYRHYYNHMSTKELAQGPNTVAPDTSGTWNIFSAKLEGANPGFFIEDGQGNRFLIKFDGPNYPELTTSAEVISSKIFYAAGYNVPEATITYFDPNQVTIKEGVTVMEAGEERPMTMEDYRAIVGDKPRNKDGHIRAVASKFVNGTPVGQWAFEGTRADDPNDRVKHEHRRELRGMRILSSWVNDTDRRDANTMAVYTDKNYIKHYVQDFGNTLGANGTSIHEPIYGQAYLIDPRYMGLNAISLGLKSNSWETVDAQKHIPHPSVGYFRADIFKPGRWVSAHPLPAYENMTLRDAFWGAKQVMSFSDEDIQAIVETGKLSNPEAEKYLTEVLINRRNKIGRYWFSRINPIDKFHVEKNKEKVLLSFEDLGIHSHLYDASQTHYEYKVSVVDGKSLLQNQKTQKPNISVNTSLIPKSNSIKQPTVLKYKIVTRRTSDISEKSTWVYVALETSNTRVIGIKREE
ncbi:hypothetical protein [Fodinibius sp.]|uniref:hypothetical protein n=1 Tax=Fodinibius sp. TaxID=1872440 RepID=UPI002ACD3A89|nr:hypothetical protein [Fodinibius sp.]MDZ7659015.1 hypothetical protein [Fodinibius sp.]